jgi:hypothetical protein
LKVNGVRRRCTPLLLILPDGLVHVLELRNGCLKLELILIGIIPLTDLLAARNDAVLEIVADALSERLGVTILRTFGSDAVNVKDVDLFAASVS